MEQSSYLRYLPPAFWSRESDPHQTLGRLLRIFEKILTGIPDNIPIASADKNYLPIREIIDGIPKLFNPWRTPADFLIREIDGECISWLGSWVALELDPTWSEYQQRKLIADIVSIYRLRGLEEGMHTYLDIFAQTKARPRIAIDDSTAVLRARIKNDGTALLHAVAHSQTITFPSTQGRKGLIRTALIHPVSIAVDAANQYWVLDQGVDERSDDKVFQQPALWRISDTGEIPYSSSAFSPLPQPIHSTQLYQSASAVVIDNFDRCSVISVGNATSVDSQNSVLHRFTPPNYTQKVVLDQSTTPKLPAIHPVDMTLDQSGNFIILDRGTHLISDPPSGFPAAPRIVVVQEQDSQFMTEVHMLKGVTEPTAIVREPTGTFIVADAGNQFDESSVSTPGTLVRVDPNNNWSVTPLLRNLAMEENPLVFPTGLVMETKESLLVCDTGLRWGFKGDQSNRSMAEPAAILRIDLGASPPIITRVSSERKLVQPTKIIFDQMGDLLITDRGNSLRGVSSKRNWRARPNEFGVIVHFSRQRPTSNEERNRIRRGIRSVVEQQKPSHATAWLKSE